MIDAGVNNNGLFNDAEIMSLRTEIEVKQF